VIAAGNSILIPLAASGAVVWGGKRTHEPVTVGVPLPRGAVLPAAAIRLETKSGDVRDVQAQPLDFWPDGSIRWLLLDLIADADDGRFETAVLRIGNTPDSVESSGDAPALRVVRLADGLEVTAGGAAFRLIEGHAFPFAGVSIAGVEQLAATASGFQLIHQDRMVTFVTSDVTVHQDGPLRAEIDLRARPREPRSQPCLEISARLEFFAGSAVVRAEFTIHNPQRARHSGGQWPLGDPGSVLIHAAELTLSTSRPLEGVRAAIEHGRNLEGFELPFNLHQESSGGEHWNSPVHRNRDAIVPLRFRGYRLQAAATARTGLRATPIVVAHTAAHPVAVAVPQFWQNFPQSIAVDGDAIRIGFLPRDSSDRHELQGGERKSWRAVIAFGGDRASDPPLAWCHEPLALSPPADWHCATQAVPFLVPAGGGDDARYAALVDTALDVDRGFFAKREQFDEFGWRHFGDLPADHESAFQPPDQPFVSHYNNQYDPIAGFALHFLRTGDRRWYELMNDLARHVRDIDIYHTTEDKAAYNGGLFWHTYHYADAATSTHRTYPQGLNAGGGPSAEHNYPTGLMLHYFLTGERASRDAAIELARWVLAMDDGRLTPFRWLASEATGHASATGSPDYHGPGRGAANSIVACRTAHRLTGDPTFAAKADELIRRCIHPLDDLEALNLRDTERRWYYTVFLQALGTYLAEKKERGERDQMFEYAQASLLHYARWMSAHERPYLDRPEVLEYPTETWAAQDLRKADVFWWAALHAPPEERDRFLERARFFFDYAVTTLTSMPTRHFTRPLVLVLTSGLRAGRPSGEPDRAAAEPALPSLFPKRQPFVPQRAIALERAKWLLVAAAAMAALATWVALTM
jgi:hypothetical protein